MPQLDKVTFLSQFFWLFVFFSIFYVFSLKMFLPQMSRVLKFRRKQLASINRQPRSLGDNQEIDLSEENSKVWRTSEAFFENTVQSYKNIFNQNKLKTKKWLDDYTNTVNRERFLKGNTIYLKSIGEQSLSNSLAIQSLNHNFSDILFYTRLNKRYITLLSQPVYKRKTSIKAKRAM